MFFPSSDSADVVGLVVVVVVDLVVDDIVVASVDVVASGDVVASVDVVASADVVASVNEAWVVGMGVGVDDDIFVVGVIGGTIVVALDSL